MEHKMKQDSLEKSQSDLKKLRRKSQGKNANKYENKESEVRRMQTCIQMCYLKQECLTLTRSVKVHIVAGW